MAEQRRRGLSQLEATPVVTNKPRPVNRAAPVQRSLLWHLTPAGIRNNIAFERKRWGDIVRSDPQRQPGQGQGLRLIGPFGSVWEFGGGKPKVLTPTLPQRDLVRGAAQLPVNALRLQETLVTRGRNAAQALLTGGVPGAVQAAMQPVDTATTPGGRFLSAVERALDAATLMPDPLTRKPDELMYQGLGENLAAGIVGAGIAQKVVGANAFTQGAAKNLAPWAQQALRWTAGTGTESVIATPLVDNTKGNLANAFGENAPLAVQPTDDPLSATAKSLLPNAFGEITAAGAFLGASKALGAIGRRLNTGREIQEVTNARNWSVENGLQAEADGKFDFPAQQQAPQPEAPKTMADAEAQLLGTEPAPKPIPSQPMEMGGAVTEGKLPEADPAANPWYDPALPELDTAVRAAQRLEDQRLQAAASGQGPVLPELEKQLTEQQGSFQLQEGLELQNVSADLMVLAKPMVPYEDQWAQLPTNTLLSLAHPTNSADLFGAITRLTGRDFGQFTRGDVLEGLYEMHKNGRTLLPNRVQEGGLLYDVNAIQVDPQRFQFKDNVNAQGQQIGNSLSGVDRWNTDAEGAIQIWTDPQDGLPYVVNGHNRLAKAKELGIPTIRAEELLAKTPEQARAQGAISNIAQGGGTPFDAAKFIREAGIQDAAGLEAAGIPLNSGTGAQGLALSKLPDNLFQAAVNGELPMGRALALGGSGLDPEGMTRVYQLAQGREMTDRTFAELTQMASTAPKVESDQMGLFGPEMIDTTVMKADLAGRIRAELTGNKNLFRKVGRNKSATALQEKAGTTVDQGAAADAASTAEAVLADFDQTKYAADTPISQLLNDGAAEIAAGAKPAVVARRILQQLEVAAEQSPPAPVAKAPALVEAPAVEPAGLSPQQRTELQKQVIQRAIDNGEVRPSETPIPELPPGPRDLNDPVKTLEDEIRLAGEYGAEDALRAQAELDAKREQMGWDRMSLSEKKANGLLDGWEPVAAPQAAAAFSFPADLAKSKPRYGMATVEFATDFDRAAYMLRDASKKSKGEDRLIAALEAQGFDIAEVRKHGQKVNDSLKAAVKEQTGSARAPQSAMSLALKPVSDIDMENRLLGLDHPAQVLLPEDVAARRTLEGILTEAVQRITGRDDVYFHGQLPMTVIAPEHGGDGIKKAPRAGFYEPTTDLINVMGMLRRTPSQITETTYHESWHRIQYTLLTRKDMEVFDSVFGKTRVNDLASLRSARGKASLEKQAYAFQMYASARAEGIMPLAETIRTMVVDGMDANFPRKDGNSWEGTLRGEAAIKVFQGFERVVELIERVNNAVRGRGFESVQSLYEKAFQGELAKSRALDYAAMQSTPDQMQRLAKLSIWRADNNKAVTDISQMVNSIDEQINALKAQASNGGC